MNGSKIQFLFILALSFLVCIHSICLQDKHRPQLHFSPISNWLNDPNGLVYHGGEFHLYYQYHPYSTVWGPMHWGHATSTNLVHWVEHPISLYPDHLGDIFSGSAIVDFYNNSGLATRETVAPILALFTHAGSVQQQSLAFSNDFGYNFEKYSGNPVLPNIDPVKQDFRDPKVIQFSTGLWVMLLAAGDRIVFYESTNLLTWTETGSFGSNPAEGSHDGVWECPDLVKLDYEGRSIWVLIVSINPGGPNGGSATQYFLGEFNGKVFRSFPIERFQWLDYGPDNYAGVTFYNERLGRTVLIGWMNNWKYANEVPTDLWRGQMTFPRVLSLAYVDGKVKLVSSPVEELVQLRNSSQYYELGGTPITIQPSEQFPLFANVPFRNPLLEIDLTFDLTLSNLDSAFIICFLNSLQQEMCIAYETAKNQVYLDRGLSGNTDFSPEFNSRSYADRMTSSKTLQLKIYLDVSSVEVFVDGGFSVLTGLYFPDEPFNVAIVSFFSENEQSRLGLVEASVRGLNSIYDC